MKIETLTGGCSTKNRPVSFQFSVNGDRYTAGGSFIEYEGKAGGDRRAISGDFYVGQSFRTRGCICCGNKALYQCGECKSFVCYNGEAQTIVCPVCHKEGHVPKIQGDRIYLSSGAPDYSMYNIIMAVDVSGSMGETTSHGHTRLDDMKVSAIDNFIDKFHGANMALVSFGSSVNTVVDFTKDPERIKAAVNSLTSGGGTVSPLRHISENYGNFLKNKGAQRYIVIFTDGEWSGVSDGHIVSAGKIKETGVEIITIGCAGADMRFLTSIATPGASIDAKNGDFAVAYARAAEKIQKQ